MTILYLNGQYCPLEKATISVLDRGFLFGDGVYEVIPVYQRQCYQLLPHLERLANSLKEIDCKNPYTVTQWTTIIDNIIAKNEQDNQTIYCQVSRGIEANRLHTYQSTTQASVMVMSQPLPTIPVQQHQQGIKAITLTDTRWQRCDIKAISLLANCLLKQKAYNAGAAEALLIRDGKVTEGAASNVYVVLNDVIYTAPANQFILAGITRQVLLTIAAQKKWPVKLQAIEKAQLLQAQEIWISSSTKEILPVTVLDNKPVGEGKPGPIWRQFYQAYQQQKSITGSGEGAR